MLRKKMATIKSSNMLKLSIVMTIKKRIVIQKTCFVLVLIPILISIVFNFRINLYVSILNYISFIFLLIWLCFIYFIKTYRVIGSIVFYDDCLVISIPKSNINKTTTYSNIKQITFYYNDIKGDSYSGSFIGFGAFRTKDGVNNYIDINRERYQVLIESISKLNLIIYTMDILLKKGISAKIGK